MFQKVKGFQDIFGDDCAYWEKAESTARKLFRLFNIHEIRLPMLERTEVFNRGIGGTTDIVEKEMFTMQTGGKNEDDILISLRPEGTAGVVRAYIENKIYNIPGLAKYYYIGPMFRKENPQKGRYRQFTQAGIEFLGSAVPFVDADVINIFVSFYKNIGLGELTRLEINSIGCKACRPAYQQKLIQYLTDKKASLCPDCLQRLERNPLRILDCKNAKCVEIVKTAPVMLDHLCPECEEHFAGVQHYLKQLGVAYSINKFIVRGLDYYMRTAFEMIADTLGTAAAVGGGGRYDGLVETLGGPATPGVGFAIGMDRVIALLKEKEALKERSPLVYLVTFGGKSTEEGIKLLNRFRKAGIAAEIDYEQKGIKNQMKKADRSNAKYAVIVGEDEIARGAVTLRALQDSSQQEVPLNEIETYICSRI